MKKLILLNFLCITAVVQAQEINIIPKPVSVTLPKITASFNLTPATQFFPEGSNMENAVNYFNEYLQEFYHFKLNVVKNATGNNTIRLNYEKMDDVNSGAYQMTVDAKGIYIAGGNENGVFYGIQTLIQLLPLPSGIFQFRVPYCNITDYPRFPYRGMHLDCGRHFFSVDFIKKYIDWIALHKMNYFHWHLTEDQGWRIEIKKYPRLAQVGAWRNGTIIGHYPGTGNDSIRYGGFYTQEQIKEVVKYAADRYITVIPEIEMPGHSSAALAAYPFLGCTKGPYQVQQTWGVFDDVFCAGNDSTYKFLENVLDEVMALFPSKYIHIGGDECPKTRWKTCPVCQKRIKDEKLKDENALQSYFIQRIEKYLNSKGRTIIGWDEILEGGVAPNAIVMSWRGEEGGIDAARQNHDVIMTPGGWCYFDHSQSENEDSVTFGGYTPVEKVYGYEPVPDSLTTEQRKHVLGAQGNVWTEYMSNDKKVEYMIFPRMSALSEVLWSTKQNSDWKDFEKRLLTQFRRYDLWKTNYSKAYFELKTTVLPTDDYNGVLWKVESKFNKLILVKFIGEDSVWGYVKPQLIQKSTTAYAYFNIDNKIISVSQNFHFNKATGKKITLTNPPSKNYPGDGAFTLVDGVQNEKGMASSNQLLGFLGTDCEAVIDLGKTGIISNVIVHTLKDENSWIWPPQSVEVFSSFDGQTFTSLKKSTDFKQFQNGNGTVKAEFKAVATRFVKIIIKNWGEIPQGNPGAGINAWLFVDEIEIN